jgi:hypothetical protein
MPKKLLVAAVIAAILITGLLAFRPNSDKCDKSQVCCEKASPQCSKEEKKAADDVILENLSRQFITIIPSGF